MHGALARACGVSLRILMIVYIECPIGETIDEEHLDYSLQLRALSRITPLLVVHSCIIFLIDTGAALSLCQQP